jgi:uncharacterized protein
MRALFLGSNGVRAGWRFLGYLVLLVGLDLAFQAFAIPFVARALHVPNGLTAQGLLLSEIFEGVAVFGATAVLAAFERKRIDAYGLPLRLALRNHFWEGTAIGVVTAGAVAVAMIACGAMTVGGLAIHGMVLLGAAISWLVAMLLVGINEEYMFRGYPLHALTRGMGFWPAAIVLSLLFGAAHLTKPGENAVDITNIVLLGLLLCLTLQRTGSLWLAVGFHFSFDFMQFFVIGTRNGGAQPVDHLLNVSFPGPAWINGGSLGTEASYFMLPVIALTFLYIALRFPKPAAPEQA